MGLTFGLVAGYHNPGDAVVVTGIVPGSLPPSGGLGGQVLTADGVGGSSFQYGNLSNVLDMGVKGDGVTDDGPALQALFNAFRNSGVGLFLPSRLRDGSTAARYLISTVVNPVSNLRCVIDDSAVVDSNISGGTTDKCPFYYTFGPLATGSTTVSTNATLFSDTLALANVTTIVPGTYIAIFDQTLGFRGGIYKVLLKTGATPGTVTLDRPVLWPFQVGDPVSIYNGVGPDGVTKNPNVTNFILESPGVAIFEGECTAYMNLVGAENCAIGGFRGQPGGSGTGLSSDAGWAFQIGYRNRQRDLFIDGGSHNSPNKGVPLVAQEQFWSERVTMNGIDQNAFGIQDCVNSDFVQSVVQGGAGNGIVLGTETVATSGIQANRWIRFRGVSVIGCGGNGIDLGVGDSYNSFHGFVIAKCGGYGIDGNDGANATPCAENAFSQGWVYSCTLASLILPQNAVDGKFDSLVLSSSAARELVVSAGASRNRFTNLQVHMVPGNVACAISDDTTIDGFTATMSAASSIAIEVNAGRVRVRNYDITMAANSDAFYVPGGVLDVADGIAAGSNSGTTGVQTNGGTARVGDNNDFSHLGASFLNSAGYISKMYGLAIGASPAAVPWPDLKATDVVKATLATSANNLAPVIVRTPGTGFSYAGGTGDTVDIEIS